MELSGNDVLKSLRVIRWDVAANTYGNNHATLIGLLVEWWVSLEPGTHRAVESGPTHGRFPRGLGGEKCDAVFCENYTAGGVLEVEGLRIGRTIEKIGKFLDSKLDDLKTLRFAVALLYPATPLRGRGCERNLIPCWDEKVRLLVEGVSRKHCGKPIIVVTLDKVYERQVEGIRRRTEYYQSKLKLVRGFVYEGGKEVASDTLWPSRV